MSDLGMAWTAALAAFSASFVEAVEAFTVILAVGLFQGWRPALSGALAGAAILAAFVLLLGPLVELFPLHVLQVIVGVLLLLFGLRWLRKAILRSAGIVARHDETAAFALETAALREAGLKSAADAKWIAGMTAFKAVLLEGIEVIFIVIAVGAARNAIWPASLGALVACATVMLIGIAVHRPLSRVPENTLKFGVGVMLSAFGIFWTGEGLGVEWPGSDFAILGFIFLLLFTALALVAWARHSSGARIHDGA